MPSTSRLALPSTPALIRALVADMERLTTDGRPAVRLLVTRWGCEARRQGKAWTVSCPDGFQATYDSAHGAAACLAAYAAP